MTEFNELKSTNDYLVSELITARKTNDLMAENNRRLENLLIKAIADLRAADELMNQLRVSVDDLTDVVTNQITKMMKK
tara:strand:- start:1549 stop:1782 length:234 start_codon:yes stop_codon:yes gene_type:complete